MRKEFELSDEQFASIMDASKPTPVMYLSGGQSMFNSPQENANHAWKLLGQLRGFQHMTVQPSSKGPKFFTAEEVATPPHA